MTERAIVILLVSAIVAAPASAQQAAPSANLKVIDLATAVEMARKNNPVFQTAMIGSALAHEDRVQAKAGLLPSLSYLNQYIYTQGNGRRQSGVFIANDGVHVYNSQAVVHEDLSFAKRSDYLRTIAAEAAARARQDIAERGLVATVAQNYYALVTAGRKNTNAKQSMEEARQFVDLTTRQEQGGEVAHADVVKAQLTSEQRQRDLQDAGLALEKARIGLAVLLFPDFRKDFGVVDDLEQAPPLASLADVRSQASLRNPEIRAAEAALQQEKYDVSSARDGYLPAFSFDFFYGIDANQFAFRAPDGIRNLGYSAQGSLIFPLWNWKATASRVQQAKLRREQARVELSYAQRQLLANLDLFYREAASSRAQVASLKRSLDLAGESLKLTMLRYQSGEATALEVTDAQASLALARNAYDDGLTRYRLALAALQTLTGI